MPLPTMALLMALAGPGHAYETDQLTHRNNALDDLVDEANQHMDELLGRAIEVTNARTGCSAGLERTRQVLASQIHRFAGRDALVWNRGVVRMWGFTRYAAWLETRPAQKRSFSRRYDIFADLTFIDSPVLFAVGPCGTVKVAGVTLGTDKFDHYFTVGYDYYEKSGWGANPDAAVTWGTATERTYWGTLTSRTFSFADLRANYDGMAMYMGLLEGDSPLQRGEDGCVVQARPWDWRETITWEYDEVLNPSVFAPLIQDVISQTLYERREELCAEYAEWGGDAYREHLRTVLASWPPYVLGPAPARSDPFQLDRVCFGDPLWSKGAPATAN